MAPLWAVTWQIEQEVEPPTLEGNESRPLQKASITGPQGIIATKEWVLPWVKTVSEDGRVIDLVQVTPTSGTGIGVLIVGRNTTFTGDINDANPPIAIGTNCTLVELADSGPFIGFNFPSRIYTWWKVWSWEQTDSSPSISITGALRFARRVIFEPEDATIVSVASIDVDADTGTVTATRSVNASQPSGLANSALVGFGELWRQIGTTNNITFTFNGVVDNDFDPQVRTVVGVHNGQVELTITEVRALLAIGIRIEVITI